MREEIISPPFWEGLPFCVLMTGTSYCDGSYHIHRAVSDVTCIEYVVSGCGTVHCGSQTVYPQGGDMYLLPEGEKHDYASDGENPWVKIWVNCTGELALQLLRLYGLSRKVLFPACDGSSYIRHMHQICQRDDLTPYEIQTACAGELLGLVQFLAKSTAAVPEEGEAGILRAYLDKKVMENVSTSEMAEVISKSVSQTIRIFKAAYGKTPYEYLLEQKMERARLFLKGTGMSVKAAAKALGFSDEHYFSGLFRKKTGMSPTEYRRRGI
ncbi:AraC family transcriptional regulator [Ructibacterium gallinarum]|uniref:AraC family transcriptional regulator n=1 Tax=Ructibacterium gallinarum TaxID=2779355 RepID=A0A9D5R9H7_9FIRM|nr:AraC family transcriptional regulator [Ructibacterium gallinarum]MBE5041095.1 AraC family transcriptional regulator [Ructibacterium gallinarum]